MILGVAMSELFETADIVILCLEIGIISLLIFFHVQTHATDCRGQLITKTKTPEGRLCTRQAKLSIHEAQHLTELQTLNENSQE